MKVKVKGGKCAECGYVFKPEDGKYWKRATICESCLRAILVKEEKERKENGSK